MAYDYDLFTIGAGSGGVRASRLVAMTGAKVGVAEEYRPGGTCVVRGCIPKKYMVYASEFGRAIKHMEGYGWSVENPRYDHGAFMDRLHREVDRLSGIYARNLRNAGAELIDDRAEFVDAHTLRLVKSNRTVTAKKILIAVGAAPAFPGEVEGAELAISSNEIFHLETLPKHIAIFGGGYIAVEFAAIMNGLGVNTCLVYRGETVLRGFDDDVRTHVHDELKRKGVKVVTHASPTKLEKIADGRTRVSLDNGESVTADVVMLATGRDPATKGLGLEKAGVNVNSKGAVIVDDYSRSSVEHIFAVGDVTDRLNLTPVAIREGQAFAMTEFMDQPTAFDHTDVPTAVFVQPPVGVVGLTEAEARKKFGKIDVYKVNFRPMKDMLTGDEERVLMKIVVRAEDERVLGVHIVGPEAHEIIQAVAIAVKMGATKKDFDNTCALHPSIAEELVTIKEKWTPPELSEG
ncbi:MAG: glutathione-disulfide reductase [Alphaproteobacteria bacterium]|nr:glutathione-disulfide reductase [Alphaproteobacteria bacterium]